MLAFADRARDAGDWPLAARHYREVLAKDPGNARIWVQYGHALKEGGNMAEAETAYRKSLALDGQSADTHLQLGHVLKLQGRKEDAAAAYFRALALERPVSPAAGELLALCWEPIARLDANWRQHSPALLNGVASLNALAHEQARLARMVEDLRREVDALGARPDRPARTNGEVRPGALPERA
ncbi:MAG: tetratricopeptide repeat protein [Stellaceae bacterium]